MPWWAWLLVSIGVVALIYSAFVIGLILAGRRNEARALATFIPDCIVLVTRLARDARVPRRRKLLLLGLVAYLALPFDLVPDFIPVAGQLVGRFDVGRRDPGDVVGPALAWSSFRGRDGGESFATARTTRPRPVAVRSPQSELWAITEPGTGLANDFYFSREEAEAALAEARRLETCASGGRGDLYPAFEPVALHDPTLSKN